ncbi:hypothetical protein ICY20_25155, partial [Pseudomonas sp. P115]|uniref:hypothetical protein n=1 Tax=Pseudomonas pisciculturae TaxID=2730413 RepID=UPI00189273B0
GESGSVPHVGNQELPGGRTYYFDVPNELVKAIAKGSAVVHYRLEGNGQPPKRSHNLFLSVIGEVIRWPAPWVVEQVGGILDPDLTAITVQFPAQALWRPDDEIQVNLLYSDASNTIEYKVSARFDSLPNNNGTLSFVLTDANIKRFDGLRMEVFYVLLRNGLESLRESYQVGEPKRDMPAPQIEKESGGQLDPGDVPSGAEVVAPFTGTLVGDRMTLFWSGPLASTQVEKDVVQSGAQTKFVVAHAFIAANLGHEVLAWYILERGTERPRYSEITPVLIAEGLADLPPPDLIQAVITGPGTATLVPLDALNGSKLRVSYAGMRNDDEIKAYVSGTPGDGSPDIPSKWGDAATQWVEFDVSRETVAANIGNGNKIVTIRYEVTRAGKQKESQALTVTVTPIPQDELNKTIIRINEADPHTQILDLTKVTEGATSYVGTWPFITAPWPVWLRLKGKKNGVDYAHTLYDGSAGAYVNAGWIANGYFEYPIPYDYLKELDHGSVLIMEFKAAFSGSTVEADAISFRETQYSVMKQEDLSLDFTPFDNYSFNGWEIGPAADPRDLRFRVDQGRVRLFNNSYSNKVGVLLKKTFENMRIGARYQFRTQFARVYIGGTSNIPIISLETSQGILVPAISLTGTNWHVLEGEFVANTTMIEFRVNHLLATHDGNDYDIAYFVIKRL